MNKTIRAVFEGAAAWAAGGERPSRDALTAVLELEPPRISKTSEARDLLWEILSHPERGRSLAILRAVGLLTELFPSWSEEISEQDLRLRSVEEIHLERWACGLGEYSFGRLCTFHDATVSGGLNGWALTALATLLARDNEQLPTYLAGLRLDLTSLGATDDEIERVSSIVSEYPVVFDALARGQAKGFRVLPATLVAALATIHADDRFEDEHRIAAIHAADKWISGK